MRSVHVRCHVMSLLWVIVMLTISGCAVVFGGEALDTLIRANDGYHIDELFLALNLAGVLALGSSLLLVADFSNGARRPDCHQAKPHWLQFHDALTSLSIRQVLHLFLMGIPLTFSLGQDRLATFRLCAASASKTGPPQRGTLTA